jgi:hypothetical protein
MKGEKRGEKKKEENDSLTEFLVSLHMLYVFLPQV